MDTTMELDELKHAWQALGRQLERQEAIQWQLLRERKLERVRHGLRPLVWGQVLQMLLGLGLIALGVACWTGNAGVPGLFWSGVLVHAFGVAHVALAPQGLVLLRTDHAGYFEAMESTFGSHAGFERVPTPPELPPLLTDFEREFHARGIPTHHAAYRRLPTQVL